jgi:hypothetical protein
VSEEDDDRALLAWLQAGRRSDGDQDALDLKDLLLDAGERPAADLDSELRDFGLSANERRTVLRPIRRSRQDSSRHKTTVLKQFRWWIDKRGVDWSKTDLHPDWVVGTWVSLTNYDLDLAKSWWDAGIDPLDLKRIADLSEHGLRPRDLVITIDGRTILEQLRRGSSVEWCIQAAKWARHKNMGA